MQKIKIPAIALVISLCIVIVAVLTTNLLYREKEVVKRGFEIEISSDGKAVAKKEEVQVDLASMMKLADANRGEKIFKKCASCHSAEKSGGNKVGPNLFGIVGKARAATSGFSYSDAMKSKGGSWDKESLDKFITKPKDFVAGTKMAFPGLKKPQDRADVILFLETRKN